MPRSSAILIGAGISGMAKAFALQREGWSVCALETADRPGGPINSHKEAGYLAEEGPNSLLLNDADLLGILTAFGLKSEIVEAAPQAHKRYLVRNGQLVSVPTGPLDAITSPLFSPAAKLRILLEPLIRKPTNLVEESVASFVTRRLGPEMLDYAINPLVGGIYAGDPRYLSLQHAFPKMAALEERHRSLILGAIARFRSNRKKKSAFSRSRTISFRNGMGSLPQAMAAKLGDDLHCGVTLHSIEKNGDWQVTWSHSGQNHTTRAEHLIVAVPAWKLSDLPLPASLITLLSPLGEIPHPPVSTLFLGFKREQVQHPLDGFGVLIPEKERRSILGVLFSSTLFPNRAPQDHVALTIFLGGARSPDIALSSAENQLKLALSDLRDLLGVTGEPSYVHHTHWPRAIPQYVIGHQRHLDTLALAEKNYPNLHFTGNYRYGISVGQCLLANAIPKNT